MHLVLVSPGSKAVPSGNGTTLRRLAHGLRAAGHDVREIHLADRGSPSSMEADELEGADLVHALHVRKAGAAVRTAAEARRIPLVVSVTGTDVYEDLLDASRARDLLVTFRSAAAIIVPDPGVTAIIARFGLERRCVVVPRAIDVHAMPEPHGIPKPPTLAPHAPEPRAGNHRTQASPNGSRIVFLHLGGWRAVKNQLFPLEPLARLAAELPGLSLRFLGPVVEPAYHEEWTRLARGFGFAEAHGPVEPSAVASAIASASVVLNVSHSEGGANAILEAMASARPVLASDVPGNAAMVRFDPDRWEDSTGVLYRTFPGVGARRIHDAEDFLAKARRLALDSGLRARMGQNARRLVLDRHRSEKEIAAVSEAYRQAREEAKT